MLAVDGYGMSISKCVVIQVDALTHTNKTAMTAHRVSQKFALIVHSIGCLMKKG